MKQRRTFKFWIIILSAFACSITFYMAYTIVVGRWYIIKLDILPVNHDYNLTEDTIADINKVIESDPNYARAYVVRGRIYKSSGDYEQAIADFTKAIELDPDYTRAYLARGLAHKGSGDYEQAIADFTKAIELEPDFLDAYFQRARVFYDLGNHKQAIADFTNIIELEPDTLTAISGQVFFEEFPPKIFFADGSTLSGNEFIDLSFDVQPYDTRKIIAWDWSGTDITVESQRVEKRTNSIQYRVIQELLKEDYEVIFDDDAGEAADVAAIRNHDKHIEVKLFHCKFSSESFVGQRVSDLYEVCGQAQKSIRWKAQSSALFDHLLGREPRIRDDEAYSRFERGDKTILLSLRNKSRQYPVEFSIYVVQPGLSSNPSTSQLELLSVTENHLMVTRQIPFQVIGNKLGES